MTFPILIIGGGLGGLTAAYRLRSAGIDFVLLEARHRLGGRILSSDAVATAAADDAFDLGPSWFWPAMQPEFAALVEELGVPVFLQHGEGDVVFERMSREQPLRYRPQGQAQDTMRLAGGTGALVAALAARLSAGTIHLEHHVTRIDIVEGAPVVFHEGRDGTVANIQAERIILAMPPRLIEASISFSPHLDEATTRAWRNAPTWMAPHAKFFAVYDRPFWRDAGLSGTAQSMVGPLAEIHDATTASGRAALFGFFAPGAEERAAHGEQALTEAALKQLVRLFGPEATSPRATLLKDWAADPLTATPADRVSGGHPLPGGRSRVVGAWADRLFLAGSESSDTEPGYLAGAVAAARQAVAEVTAVMAGARTVAGES